MHEIQDRFTRSRLLFGEGFSHIATKRAIIFGVGGVGGFALDGLYRAGCRNITIVDKDCFDITNQNRQIGAESIGEVKVKVLEQLYPGVVGIEAQLDSAWLEGFMAESMQKCAEADTEKNSADSHASSSNDSAKQFCGFDYVIDAIDDIPAKILLAKACAHMPYGRFICSTGSAKKLNPLEIKVASIWKSYGDKFARKLRDGLKKQGFKGDYKTIFSPEPPKCKGLGSFSAVTASFGLQIASEVIRDILASHAINLTKE